MYHLCTDHKQTKKISSSCEGTCCRDETHCHIAHFLCLSLTLSLQHWDISQTKIRVISTLLFVLFGCLLFVALPAAIFKHIEGWSALESLYFVVITLTTIGFGDFVAGMDMLTSEKKSSICVHHTDLFH